MVVSKSPVALSAAATTNTPLIVVAGNDVSTPAVASKPACKPPALIATPVLLANVPTVSLDTIK